MDLSFYREEKNSRGVWSRCEMEADDTCVRPEVSTMRDDRPKVVFQHSESEKKRNVVPTRFLPATDCSDHWKQTKHGSAYASVSKVLRQQSSTEVRKSKAKNQSVIVVSWKLPDTHGMHGSPPYDDAGLEWSRTAPCWKPCVFLHIFVSWACIV